jgi:hypothetical protein
MKIAVIQGAPAIEKRHRKETIAIYNKEKVSLWGECDTIFLINFRGEHNALKR